MAPSKPQACPRHAPGRATGRTREYRLAMMPNFIDEKGGLGGTAFNTAVSLAVDVDPKVSIETLDCNPLPEAGQGAHATARKRARRVRPEYIRDVRRHMERTFKARTGSDFQWTALYRANLRTMMGVYSAWEIMALWDLYIEASRNVYRLYYMEREAVFLMDDPRFKDLCRKHEEFLIHLGRRG